MTERYELRNDQGELIRIFMSLEEAEKYLTDGDYLVKKVTPKEPKVSPYEIAMKRVGAALF